MTVCPIAVVAGCRKCPAFALCPLKGVIGDFDKNADAKEKAASRMKPRSTKRVG